MTPQVRQSLRGRPASTEVAPTIESASTAAMVAVIAPAATSVDLQRSRCRERARTSKLPASRRKRQRGPDVPRRRVGGEAEAEQYEEEDDRRQRLAQAQREERRQPDRGVHDQREDKAHVGLGRDLERKHVQGVGATAGPELLQVERELPAGSVDIHGHRHLGTGQEIRAEWEQEQGQRPGAAAKDARRPGQRRDRGGQRGAGARPLGWRWSRPRRRSSPRDRRRWRRTGLRASASSHRGRAGPPALQKGPGAGRPSRPTGT